MDEEKTKMLRDRLRGPVFTPTDMLYEKIRRGWNYLFDKRPSAIARCTGAADIIAAVKFAQKYNLAVSVRSGGHDYAGTSTEDDSLLIDLSLMNAVQVDPTSKTVRVQPGATWGDVDHETQAFGLATPGATVSTVGVAGFLLGGGSGYLSRKFGLGVDNLLSADVITADGEFIHASKNENSDLFWAIRGGSGNFGIVSSFELQLHEVGPEILTAQYFHPFEDAQNVLKFYRSFTADAPPEMLCYAFIIPIPPVEPFPEKLHGKPCIALIACYSGDRAKGEELFEELQTFGEPIIGFVQSMPYTELQKTFDSGVPKGLRWYSKARNFKTITDELIDQIVKHTRNLKGAFTMVYLDPGGGAASQVDSAAMAYPHRDNAYTLHILAGWAEDEKDEETIEWVRKFEEDIKNKAQNGVYVNLLGPDEKERVQHAYGSNYKRLREIKQKWDPDNFFSSNHNIPPIS